MAIWGRAVFEVVLNLSYPARSMCCAHFSSEYMLDLVATWRSGWPRGDLGAREARVLHLLYQCQ